MFPGPLSSQPVELRAVIRHAVGGVVRNVVLMKLALPEEQVPFEAQRVLKHAGWRPARRKATVGLMGMGMDMVPSPSLGGCCGRDARNDELRDSE